MRSRTLSYFAPLTAVLVVLGTPGTSVAQGRGQANLTVTLTAVVPSIVKYVVDETTRTPDGAPTIRVITNDPAIRAAFARGVTPELTPTRLASATPEESRHAKGDERLQTVTEGGKVLRYTVVAP